MDIELGKSVMARDGEEIGTVDRLIVEPDELVVQEFLIKEGTILTIDRVVDIEHVTRIDPDGTIHLSISSEDAENLPPFVESHYVDPAPEQLNQMPEAWMGVHGGGPLFWAHTAAPREAPEDRPLFEPASVPTTSPEAESALDDTSIVIDEGTNVVDRDGEAFGSVEEVRYGPDGRISGFRVKSGTIFTSEYEIPIAWVDSMLPDSIHLSVTGEQAEAAGQADA